MSIKKTHDTSDIESFLFDDLLTETDDAVNVDSIYGLFELFEGSTQHATSTAQQPQAITSIPVVPASPAVPTVQTVPAVSSLSKPWHMQACTTPTTQALGIATVPANSHTAFWPCMTRVQKVSRFLQRRRAQKASDKRKRAVDGTKQGIANKRSRIQGRFKKSGTVWVSAQ